jgi:phage-related holin
MEVWNQIAAFLLKVVQMPDVKALLTHICVNAVVAVSAAIALKDFQLAKLFEFLWRKILPLVAVYTVARLIGDAADLSWLATTTFVMLETTLVADLVPNLQKLGIPIPDRVVQFFKVSDVKVIGG